LKITIIRLGQLCGNRIGAWNSHEWFPSIVLSSHLLGCLPSLNTIVSWIPVDTAAAVIADAISCNDDYLHLVHPNPVTSEQVLQTISLALGIPIVPFKEWRSRLENIALGKDLELHSRITMLQQFFSGMENDLENEIVMEERILSLENSLASSRTLAKVASDKLVLGDKDIKKWLEYWNVSRIDT